MLIGTIPPSYKKVIKTIFFANQFLTEFYYVLFIIVFYGVHITQSGQSPVPPYNRYALIFAINMYEICPSRKSHCFSFIFCFK